MDGELSPRLMDHASLIQAFPLVSNILPHVTLEHWTRFARDHLVADRRALPKGLMAIRNRDDYILGLFAFEVRYGLKEDRVLWVDDIIVSSMPARDLIWQATIDAIDELAKANRCGAIHVVFDDEFGRASGDGLWVKSALGGAGYLFVGAQALKRLRK